MSYLEIVVCFTLSLHCVCVDRPQTALHIIVPKIRHENEKVALLALAVSVGGVKHYG